MVFWRIFFSLCLCIIVLIVLFLFIIKSGWVWYIFWKIFWLECMDFWEGIFREEIMVFGFCILMFWVFLWDIVFFMVLIGCFVVCWLNLIKFGLIKFMLLFMLVLVLIWVFDCFFGCVVFSKLVRLGGCFVCVWLFFVSIGLVGIFFGGVCFFEFWFGVVNFLVFWLFIICMFFEDIKFLLYCGVFCFFRGDVFFIIVIDLYFGLVIIFFFCMF